MQTLDLLLKNATALIFYDEKNKIESIQVDIGIQNKKISHIQTSLQLPTREVLDLKGLHVLPGVIDSQVHFREPGLTHKEDLETGTRAAVLGGVTAIFEMPNTNPSTTTVEDFNLKLDLAKKRAHCDYGFFIGGAHNNTEQIAQLENLPHCPGVKVFLGASFGSLLVDDDTVFEKIMANGKKRVTIHCEDEARLKLRKEIAVTEAHPRAHHFWRDEESALIAVKKSIHFAKKFNRPVHILHVSSSEEMAFLKGHKDISTVEILPQYLTLSAPECYERLGTLAQQNPPIRDKRHMELLWKAVADGTVDIIGSDHAPHTLEEKNKKYPESPSGFPGVQTLLPIMLDHVNKKNITLEHFTQLVTENPRRTFNVKNKGRIAVGFDADFTVIDLKHTREITNKWIASRCGYTPFDGMKVTGWPLMTIIRGEVTMREDEVLKPHQGEGINFENSSK